MDSLGVAGQTRESIRLRPRVKVTIADIDKLCSARARRDFKKHTSRALVSTLYFHSPYTRSSLRPCPTRVLTFAQGSSAHRSVYRRRYWPVGPGPARRSRDAARRRSRRARLSHGSHGARWRFACGPLSPAARCRARLASAAPCPRGHMTAPRTGTRWRGVRHTSAALPPPAATV